ncbi:MAG TPA: tetratricopeptide repeat protein, partial [Gemmatimonadales bacterium]|nr:tetratricopeptide repeat protein [Gemmatimonadales bacterium]
EDGAGEPARSRPAGRTVALVGAVAVLLLITVWLGATRVSGAATGPSESLAVLPLHNVSGDPDQDYFADGIQDALIGELAQIGALRVISFTSALQYKNSTKSLPQIAEELGVTDVVEGSFAREGDSVRIQVELIQAVPRERHLWARTYSRDMRHVLGMYGQVAQAVAQEIQVKLTPDEATRLADARPVDPETYEAILRGKSLVSEFTADGFERGLAYLQGAVDREPDNGLAYAALALGYSLIGSHSPNPPRDAMSRARAAAEKAVALDSTLAEAHAALALIRLYGDWDWEGARAAFLRALQFNPSLAEAHAQYAWYLNLMGEQDSAVAEMHRAMALDPLEPKWTTWLGDLDWAVGHWDDAVARLQEALDRFPNFPWAYNMLGFALSRVGRHEEAIAAHRKAMAANPDWVLSLADAYAAAGRTVEARRIADSVARAPSRDAYGLTLVYATLGEPDEAMRWAEAAFDDRHPATPWIMCAMFEALHASPRFEVLRQRLNLPASSCSPDEWPRAGG